MLILCILLGIVAFLATIVAALALFDAATERDPALLLITLVCAIAAAGAGLGSTFAYKAHQATWKDSSTIVRTVFNEGEDVMLLSKYGTVYRCVEQAECQDLEKGDHVTFEWLPGGSSVQDTPDARKVVKG